MESFVKTSLKYCFKYLLPRERIMLSNAFRRFIAIFDRFYENVLGTFFFFLIFFRLFRFLDFFLNLHLRVITKVCKIYADQIFNLSH